MGRCPPEQNGDSNADPFRLHSTRGPLEWSEPQRAAFFFRTHFNASMWHHAIPNALEDGRDGHSGVLAIGSVGGKGVGG
jgi:hypothetical protein